MVYSVFFVSFSDFCFLWRVHVDPSFAVLLAGGCSFVLLGFSLGF